MLAFKCCYIGFLESEFTRFRLEGSVASYQLALPTWTRWSLFSHIPSHLICQTIQFKKHQIFRRFSLVTRISGGKA